MPLRAHLRLIRGLGPWADDARAPAAVSRRSVIVGPRAEDGQPFDALVYTPTDRAPIGSYLIAHGFNVRGPDDPRCDRFARVLSHAGFVVMCPRLHAFTRLRVHASAAADLSRALAALLTLDEHPRDRRPGIFSISFGSFAALLAAASPEARHLVGGLVVFGGYADFAATCRFMLGVAGPTTAGLPAPDPTCLVGMAINSADVLFPPEERVALTDAWRTFVTRVWGDPALKAPARFADVARELASTLPRAMAAPFLQGCGVTPGFAALAEAALARVDTAAMDPRRHLPDIRCPVHLFHGRRDDVIPYTQMTALATGLTGTRARTYLTGLYDHSRGESGARGGVARLPALLKEMTTMAGMVHAIVTAARAPREEAGVALPVTPRHARSSGGSL
ncbi:MAG: hypothetical protein ABUS79_00645 [Pseudomonadota bacterium]